MTRFDPLLTLVTRGMCPPGPAGSQVTLQRSSLSPGLTPRLAEPDPCLQLLLAVSVVSSPVVTRAGVQLALELKCDQTNGYCLHPHIAALRYIISNLIYLKGWLVVT